MGRFEIGDEAGEEAGAVVVAGNGVVVDEIAAAAAEDFADGGGHEVGGLRRVALGEKKRDDLVGIAKETAIKGVDVKRGVFVEAADEKVAGQADGLEGQTEAFGDEQIDDAERNRQADAAGEHAVEKAVLRIGVVLDVAAEAPLVEQHAVDDAAFLAGAGGFGDELGAAGGDGIELLVAAADVEGGIDGACEQERAGFELVVERLDERAKIGDGIGKL